MGVGDDPAVGRLPEDLGQPHYRHDFAFDHMPQHHARPHGRQLVDVAHQQQAGLRRQGTEQVRHENNVNHRDFVRNKDITVQRIGLISAKTACGGLDFKQAVDRLGLHAGRLGKSFGRPARGRAKQTPHFLCPQNQQDGVDESRFSNARAARDDQGPTRQGQLERIPLARGKLLAGLLLTPDDRLLEVNWWER